MKTVPGEFSEAPMALKDLSFEDFYNEYWEVLYEAAWKKTGDRQDAFDLVQDLFIYIWENRKKLTVNGSLKAYLLVSLRNAIFEHFRKNGLRENIASDFYHFSDAATLSESELLLMEILKERTRVAVEHAVEELPEKMRYMVRQRWYHHQTIDDIAAALSVSHKTVRNNLAIALQRIRKYAEDHSGPVSISVIFIQMLPGQYEKICSCLFNTDQFLLFAACL